MALVSGDRLGRYRLERLLGRGGMGEVWAAHDPDLDRHVALKVMHPQIASHAESQARFQREGRAMARLRHANVIVVYDAVFSDGRGLIAMELIDGESMATWLSRRPPTGEIVRVIRAAGEGLAAAHAAGMVHRDFKPHNVLIGRDGRVVVTDFGLARAISEVEEPVVAPEAHAATVASNDDALAATAAPSDVALAVTAMSVAPVRVASTSGSGDLATPLTETGTLLGTPAYMAPEQLARASVDERADQFAFCLTAWEAFTGTRPFRGSSLEELSDAVARGVDMTTASAIPRRLRPLLLRGLAHEPAARWASMQSLLTAIGRAWRRPRRLAIAAAMCAVIGGSTAVAIATRPVAAAADAGCGDVEAAIAPAWSPALRADLAARLAGKPYAERVVAMFDRWADTWKQTRVANCKQRSAPDFAVRQACLDGIRDEVAQTMELRTTDPEIFGAHDMPRLMPPAEACVHDPRGLSPAPPLPALRGEVIAIRSELARARIPLLMSSPLAMVVNVKPQLERARKTGYAPVIVEAQIMEALTQVLRGTGSDSGTCDAFAAAADQADAAGYGRMVVEALLLELQCRRKTRGLGDDRVMALLRRLDRITQRTRNPVQRAEVEVNLADLAADEGRLDEALAMFEHAQLTYEALQMFDWHARVLAARARVQLYRNRGDDLDRAAALLAEAVKHDVVNRGSAQRLLAQIDWRRGRAAYPGAPNHDVAGATAIVDGKLEHATVDRDAVDLAGRAARRRPATAVLATPDESGPSWIAPVDQQGRWQLPAVTPGAYVLTVRAKSALGDIQMTQRRIALRAGANHAPVLAFDAAPKLLEIVTLGANPKIAIAFVSNEAPPRSWPELRRRLIVTTTVSAVDARAPREADNLAPGDHIARVAVGDEPLVVCVLFGAGLADVAPAHRIAIDKTAKPPLCRAAHASDRRIMLGER
ncbi:MAG TPA: serine/threonine-protein kinase [Kofleriaceae bacterium]